MFIGMGNIILALAIVGVSIIFFIKSFGFPIVNNVVSAGWWPRIISILLFITSSMATFEAVKNYRRNLAKESKEQRRARVESAPGYFPWGTKRIIGTCVLFGFYILFALNYLALVGSPRPLKMAVLEKEAAAIRPFAEDTKDLDTLLNLLLT